MNEYEQQELEHAAKVANAISGYLNNFGFKKRIDLLVQCVNEDHRTLQQSFTNLCAAWLNHVGSPDYRYDGRNEASHKLGEAFQTLPDNVRHLPFI